MWKPVADAKKMVVEFVVDTGATYTVLPANVLRELDVSSVRMAKLRLPDNRILERPLGEAGIEIEGYSASATPVIFGDEGVYLLGSVAMEQLGLAPDPVEEKLRHVEALLMEFALNFDCCR